MQTDGAYRSPTLGICQISVNAPEGRADAAGPAAAAAEAVAGVPAVHCHMLQQQHNMWLKRTCP